MLAVRFLTKTNKYARMEDSDEESEEPPMPAETPMPANTAVKGKGKAVGGKTVPNDASVGKPKAATEELPELHEVFPIGAEVVVYAGAQEEADEVELENRPNFDKVYAPNGKIRNQIALVAGLVVANKVKDLVTDHLTMGAEYDLQEGQLGIKVEAPHTRTQPVLVWLVSSHTYLVGV